MSDPIRLPADPIRPICNFLNAQLPSLSPVPAVTVSLGLPSNWMPEDAPPHVGIFDDGGPVKWPIITEPRVRVTVWAIGRDLAREIAALSCGILTCRNVPGVATITDPSSILDARDPHNRGLMASFTVKVQARTITL
ncbi:hypothetical protein [Rhodococcus erythropolis]|uniref:hypothetical protein n=1 Tax=Rhodococcus erythropolis TaxID=1833 RepID=UPI001BEA988F|nr:hypothetical protein [Rhodococcus erythropolis]MBT2266317.1 hypothetical protein [Rhodococcus erythropolis]